MSASLGAAVVTALLPLTFVVAGQSASANSIVVRPPLSAPTVNRDTSLLRAVNHARATGRRCGGAWYPAASRLRYSTKLDTASTRHARDMVARNYFAHYSASSRATPTSRARTAGYRRGVGENIAAGYGSVASVMRAWLASPGHCANIMSRSYSEVGFGYAWGSRTRYRSYWVQDFGLRQ